MEEYVAPFDQIMAIVKKHGDSYLARWLEEHHDAFNNMMGAVINATQGIEHLKQAQGRLQDSLKGAIGK